MNTIEAFKNPNIAELYKCTYSDNLANINMEGVTSIDMIGAIKMANNDILLTDKEHAFCTTNSFFSSGLHIDYNYYLENKAKVEADLVSLIQKYQASTIKIKEIALITPELIRAIANNPNIKNVSLGAINDRENGFVLTDSIYQVLKQSGKESIDTSLVSDDLAENFDEIIVHNSTKPLIERYTYQQLKEATKIYITKAVEATQYRFIKFIPDNTVIDISVTDYENIIDFLLAIVKSGKNFKITISLKDKKLKSSLTKMLLAHKEELDNLDLLVKVVGENAIFFKEYLDYEKRLFDMVKGAINLSPFERYLYAYKIVSHFKKYKENKENGKEARSLYHILDNEYMVCVGYSTLLEDLLDKLDIESSSYSTVAELTFDNIDKSIEVTPEDIKYRTENHERRIIRITDPKYDIDGFYISDPTWDNVLAIDSFCFAALTSEESLDGQRYFVFNKYDSTELLNISSLEDFYTKINHIIDHNEMYNTDKPVLNLVEKLMNLLYTLDSKYITSFVKSHPGISFIANQISFSDRDYSFEKLQELLIELGDYILSKVNNPIAAQTFEQALYQMYLNAYSLEEKEAIIKTEKALHNTYVMVRDNFPKRMRINPDGTEEVYSNAINKFADYNLNKDTVNL